MVGELLALSDQRAVVAVLRSGGPLERGRGRDVPVEVLGTWSLRACERPEETSYLASLSAVSALGATIQKVSDPQWFSLTLMLMST